MEALVGRLHDVLGRVALHQQQVGGVAVLDGAVPIHAHQVVPREVPATSASTGVMPNSTM